MATIDENMVVNEVIRAYPQTIGVFNRHRIDACCGGARTVAEAAAEDGATLQDILEDLNAAAAPKVGSNA
jgi:regulator of cell morphogenesis and NO signaling